MPLSDLAVRQAKPKDKPYQLSDGGALFLEVTIAGGKRWLFRCRFEGKQVKFTLGAYPVVSLAEAREKALEAHRQLEEGKNPSIAKREAKA
ncbi:Arm DNA-binding domain-containing protein, partial [Chitinimonas taiwanensis]